MREFVLRVRPSGDAFTATLREFAATQHPEVRAIIGVSHEGAGANPSAAMVDAIAHAHIPAFTEPRRSPYAA